MFIEVQERPRLTAQKMNRKFSNQWILVGMPEYDKRGKLKSGQVVWHGKTYSAMHRAMLRIKERPYRTAEYFAGTLRIEGEYLL